MSVGGWSVNAQVILYEIEVIYIVYRYIDTRYTRATDMNCQPPGVHSYPFRRGGKRAATREVLNCPVNRVGRSVTTRLWIDIKWQARIMAISERCFYPV